MPRESFRREKVALVLGARGVAVRADASRAAGGSGAGYHMPGNESTAGRGAWQWLTATSLRAQTLGKLDQFIEEDGHMHEVSGTCSNGMCTVHGPGGSGEYSEVFEEFVPAFFAGAQDLDGLMEAAKSIGESGDMKAVQNLAEKHQKDQQKRMAPIITRIFDQFVPRKSPGVDPEICRALVKEFLTACQRHMPLLAKQSMDAGMKMGAAMSGGFTSAGALRSMAASDLRAWHCRRRHGPFCRVANGAGDEGVHAAGH